MNGKRMTIRATTLIFGLVLIAGLFTAVAITFPLGNYGEILVSVETARRQAVEFASSFERELTLYIVHGLLHLHGYEDGSTPGREEMARRQEALLEALG